jgi:uncharacterized protein YgbK (DUF1537 family)
MAPVSRQLKLAFYGDDFTGSTDAMEALSLAGLRTVLFMAPPRPELMARRFPNADCIGIAGTARTMSPDEMRSELRPLLEKLRALGTPVVHYKVCSTFDSSPRIGSIGCVIDMAGEMFSESRGISILPGVPALRRYTVFGNHFAAAGDRVYRLDRHPTMSRHPVTPMDEADLRVHLSRQTDAQIELMSLGDLQWDEAQVAARYAEKLRQGADAVLFDMLDAEHLAKVGRLIWSRTLEGQHFVVGSSGVGYALSAHWRACGELTSQPAGFAAVQPVRQLLVVSGSCSPLTAGQVECAAQNGFSCMKAPAEAFIEGESADAATASLFDRAKASLAAGRSVVIYSAEGPDDPGISATKARLAAPGREASGETSRVIGRKLGRLARELIDATGISRLAIAGGDTSSYATRELGLYALEMLAAVAPGAPLCRAHSDDARIDGLEIALKGGQMGQSDYFVRLLGGTQ